METASDVDGPRLAAVLGGPGQLPGRMGIEITDWNPRRLVATMPVDGNRQPYGLLHGGASCVLAETLGSVAASLNAGPGRRVLGVELNASHHRGTRDGVVTGVCTPLHTGQTMATYAIEITDDQGHLVCTARLTCLLRNQGHFRVQGGNESAVGSAATGSSGPSGAG